MNTPQMQFNAMTVADTDAPHAMTMGGFLLAIPKAESAKERGAANLFGHLKSQSTAQINVHTMTLNNV